MTIIKYKIKTQKGPGFDKHSNTNDVRTKMGDYTILLMLCFKFQIITMFSNIIDTIQIYITIYLCPDIAV